MKNVTLNPKEQTRPQVLNSLLAEHMTPDQAGMVGVGAEARATVALALASLPLLPVPRLRWDTVDVDGLPINGHLAGRHFHGSLARGRRIGD